MSPPPGSLLQIDSNFPYQKRSFRQSSRDYLSCHGNPLVVKKNVVRETSKLTIAARYLFLLTSDFFSDLLALHVSLQKLFDLQLANVMQIFNISSVLLYYCGAFTTHCNSSNFIPRTMYSFHIIIPQLLANEGFVLKSAFHKLSPSLTDDIIFEKVLTIFT